MQAALDISNIQPLKVNVCCLSNFPKDDDHMASDWVNEQSTEYDTNYAVTKNYL